MLKKILAMLLAFVAAAAFAAVDANKATLAELESVKGIGPSIAAKILDARKTGPFKNWDDLVDRVKGVGEGNAAKFSAAGLTVGGVAYNGAAPKPEAKPDAKPAKADKADKPAKVAAADTAASKPAKKSKKEKAEEAAAAASKPAKK